MYASIITLSIQQFITEYLTYVYALSYKEKFKKKMIPVPKELKHERGCLYVK